MRRVLTPIRNQPTNARRRGGDPGRALAVVDENANAAGGAPRTDGAACATFGPEKRHTVDSESDHAPAPKRCEHVAQQPRRATRASLKQDVDALWFVIHQLAPHVPPDVLASVRGRAAVDLSRWDVETGAPPTATRFAFDSVSPTPSAVDGRASYVGKAQDASPEPERPTTPMLVDDVDGDAAAAEEGRFALQPPADPRTPSAPPAQRFARAL